ncbi:MAG: hypothetical protein Q9220_000697 [cf. Caloplaca sp. 1 TL-2023]
MHQFNFLLFPSLPLSSLLLPLVAGLPKETGLPYRSLLQIVKRQDTDPYDGPAPEVANGDPEPLSDTDYLRDGSKPPPPADTNQGANFQVDHFLEMQNIHGAFSVLAKPSNIPQSDWDAVKKAVFSKPPSGGYPPMQTIASKISGPPNMQAIPAAINNFKGQVFRGVINNGKNAPSSTRYPTEFGFAVNKLLSDRSSSYNEVIDNLGDALQAAGNDNKDISVFFASYASSVSSSATSFLSQWTEKSGVYATATSSSSSAKAKSAAAPKTTASVSVKSKSAASTKATSTAPATCDCNEDGCTPESPACCANGTCG